MLSDYDADLVNKATYAVSLEPEGGSPSGAPTGPVVYTGKLIETVPPAAPAPSALDFPNPKNGKRPWGAGVFRSSTWG